MFAPLPLPLAPSNDFLNAGVFANVGLPTPAAFLASGLAAQSALGPPTVPSASAALGMLADGSAPPRWADSTSSRTKAAMTKSR